MARNEKRTCPACGEKKEFRIDCKTCGCGGTNPFKKVPNTDAKILFLDIETMATLAWVWALYDTNTIETHQYGYMLSFAYKWAGKKKIVFRGLPDYETWKTDNPFPVQKNDSELVAELREVMAQADIIVAHNGIRFDFPTVTRSLLIHNLPPLRPFRPFDTLQEIKRVGKFVSNKLDHLAQELDLGRKVTHTGFNLWLRCAQGDEAAWRTMKEYNIHDIELLEEFYYRLRPYSKHHPNVNHELGKCRLCGSPNIALDEYVYTNMSRKEVWRCLDCVGYFEGVTRRMK